MRPKRIQRKRTKGWRMPPNTVYVGRPTKWGNPFTVGREFRSSYRECETSEEALELFREHVGLDCWADREPIPDVATIIKELRGKDLACWCPIDQKCHADILLELANR